MSNVVNLHTRDDLLDQASEWLAKVDRGLSSAEEQALRAWFTESTAHKETFLQVAELWDRMDSLSRLADLFPQPTQNRKSPLRSQLAIAASLLLAVLVGVASFGGFGFFSGDLQQAVLQGEQHYETNTGEQSTILLADGSTLTLNTNSAIRARFTAEQRALFLDRGEVNVQVEHDADRPFNVYIGDKMVQAVGTAFNLEITDDKKVELIVTEGKVVVAVMEGGVISDPVMPVLPSEKAVATLAAGEQVMLGDTYQSVEPIRPEEIEVKLSWRGGNLVFRGESLEQAISEIERYTSVQFEILDDELRQVRVAGLFKAGDVEGLLTTLKQNFNVEYQRLSEDRILLSSLQMGTPK